MTLHDGFDRTVADWLDEQAGHGMPGYLDEILVKTTRARQRPWWSSLERWLPMQSTLRLAPVPRIAWLLVVVALAAALGVAVLGVGSRPHQPASPFGLARNGAILYGGTDNDIHALDPVTGATRALITGSSGDHGPLLSPNGTRLLFLRDTTVTDPVIGGLEPMIMVANDDGNTVRALTGALVNFNSARWSNDGSKVVVASDVDSKPALQIVSMDGTTTPLVIDTQGMTPMYVAFRPDDRELTFRGSTPAGDGLYAVGADGRGLRTILAPGQGDGASLSPDGTKLAYQVWDGTYGTIHVIDVDTGLDSIPAFDPDAATTGSVDGEPWAWSPDGDRFLFVRYSIGNTNHLAVAPATGGHVVEIGPAMPNDATGGHVEFSPDGSKVLAHYNSDGSTWLLDPTGSTPGTKLSSSIAQAASWQRQAP